MREEMTIGDLAKATGIPRTTMRFYEREGLQAPGSRSLGNYRLYGRAAAERLTFIGAAEAAGFALAEIKAVLSLDSGRIHCGRANQIVTARLASLREQMLKLRQLERVLQKIERACSDKPGDAPCVVVDPFVLRRWLRRSWQSRPANSSRTQTQVEASRHIPPPLDLLRLRGMTRAFCMLASVLVGAVQCGPLSGVSAQFHVWRKGIKWCDGQSARPGLGCTLASRLRLQGTFPTFMGEPDES